MPTYAYRCDSGHEFEVVQPITAAPLTDCGVCAGPVHRVVFPVGIVFKGQGFYKTDSRSSSSGAIGPAAATAGNGTVAKTGDRADATKPAAEPAAKSETDATKSSKESTPSVATTTGGAGGGGKDG